MGAGKKAAASIHKFLSEKWLHCIRLFYIKK
jgi:hypothetical protein